MSDSLWFPAEWNTRDEKELLHKCPLENKFWRVVGLNRLYILPTNQVLQVFHITPTIAIVGFSLMTHKDWRRKLSQKELYCTWQGIGYRSI